MLTRWTAIRDVEAAPAVDDPRFSPRVTRDGCFRRVCDMNITADVARGYAEMAAARDEDVRVILTDAALRFEGLERRRMNARLSGFERQLREHRLGELSQ